MDYIQPGKSLMADERIYVTRPALPDLDEFIPYLEQIWKSKRVTNNGPFHEQFEEELAEFLGVRHVSLCTNGTLALVTALQLLQISGEVITTPFSFVATSHALLWNNITPVFVDIEPRYCTLDPEKIEAAITPRTTAVLPVHVYGNPCNTREIQDVADRYGLKVIYDAAHTFGVRYKGRGICNFGDLSILSFHATKMFNTMEGGAVICHDAETKKQADYLKNFGFSSETQVMAPGINSKMNEVQAALGLLQLKYHHRNLEKRAVIAAIYREGLRDVKGIRCLAEHPEAEYNNSYFPVFVQRGYHRTRDELYKHLQEHNFYGRRYFYPLISDLSMYRELESSQPHNLQTARQRAEEVICLPIYPDLEHEAVRKIITLVRANDGQ